MVLSTVTVCDKYASDPQGGVFALVLTTLFFGYLVVDLIVAATTIFLAGRPLKSHLQAHRKRVSLNATVLPLIPGVPGGAKGQTV